MPSLLVLAEFVRTSLIEEELRRKPTLLPSGYQAVSLEEQLQAKRTATTAVIVLIGCITAFALAAGFRTFVQRRRFGN
jgi:hypothetical protein